MKAELDIEFESDAEMETMRMLNTAREYGIKSGVQLDVLRDMLVSLAVTVHEVGEIEEESIMQQAATHSCPECGDSIDEYETRGLGGPVVVKPCGDTVEIDELPRDVILDDEM